MNGGLHAAISLESMAKLTSGLACWHRLQFYTNDACRLVEALEEFPPLDGTLPKSNTYPDYYQ